MFEFFPIEVSPMYERWFTFEFWFIDDFFVAYSKYERPLRDLIDLDSTYRFVDGEESDEVFAQGEPKVKEIFSDEPDSQKVETESESSSEIESENNFDNDDEAFVGVSNIARKRLEKLLEKQQQTTWRLCMENARTFSWNDY